jgi:SAM-dependent methyltransferase
MAERIYTDYPELYDAIQSEWDYDRDVAFVKETLSRLGVDGESLLEVGCGTGEHTRRLLDAGFDVTAVDKYEGMLDAARGKCDATFHRAALPDLGLDGEFGVIVAIRGVVNHLPREELAPAMETLASHLRDGGVLVFDNSPLPPEGNHPALDVGTTDRGDYARIVQQVPTGSGRLEWREAVFGPDGDFFVNTREMTPFEDETVAEALSAVGLDAETVDGYGPEDRRTVFVATG